VCQTYLGQQITVLLLQASDLALCFLLVVGHLQNQLLQRLILCLMQNEQSLNQSINQSLNPSISQSINQSSNQSTNQLTTCALLEFDTLRPRATTIGHKHVGNDSNVTLGDGSHNCEKKMQTVLSRIKV